MKTRFAVIGAATVVALAVLLLTLLADNPAAPNQPRRQRPATPATPDVAPGFDQSQALDTGNINRQRPFEAVQKGGYSIVDGDRHTVMTWDHVTPRPQGVSEVVNPQARVFFAPDRVLEIQADTGTLIAPENQPREGDLRGNVVITLFESADGSPVDLDSERDIQLRTYLDEANFDLELGHIQSASDVHLTGPRVDFKGRGLSLTYNELRRRIERLEITHGQTLRFKTDFDQPDAADTSVATTQPASTQPATTQPAQPVQPQSPSARPQRVATTQPDQTQPQDAPRPLQFYRARFQQNVHVRSLDGQADMTADDLEVVFSMETHNPDAPAETEAASTPADGPAAPGVSTLQPPAADPVRFAASQVMAYSLATTNDAPPATQPTDGRTLMPFGNDDVVITWTGPLVVEPEPVMPAELAGPKDVMLTLRGLPAVVRNDRGEHIEADTIDYVASNARIRATGTPDRPMMLASRELGTLTGQKLDIIQANGVGTIQGPGRVEATTDQSEADTTAPTELTRDLDIRWQDRLELTFYLKEDDRRSDDDPFSRPDRIRALRSALFQGDVAVDHPQFEMTSQKMRLAMNDPDTTGQTLEMIEASGDVAVTAIDTEAPDQPMQIRCAELSIALDEDGDGKTFARQINARDNVVAEQDDLKLETNSLSVALVSPSASDATSIPTTQPATTQPAAEPTLITRRAAIERMTAENGVRVWIGEPATELAGDRLVIDAPADQLELFGRDDAPARVIRPDATLSGNHLVMHQKNQELHVVGPGWFDVQMNPQTPDAKLMVSWRDALHFNDTQGIAHFVGQVRTTTDSGDTRTRLECDDLKLNLQTSAIEQPATQPAATQSASPDRAIDEAMQRRSIRFATARDNVRFTADSVDPQQPNRTLTQVHLEGDLMTFDGLTEQIQVVGAGRMLIQDNRPQTQGTEDEAVAGVVTVSGRGDTLFLWQKQLTLDAAKNDMLMQQNVQMIHRPADGKLVQLDCQRLLADLTETGGLGMWADDVAPRPQISRIRADQAVRIIQGDKRVASDHLQYLAKSQTVLLWADAGGFVTVASDNEPASLTAEQMKWNLTRDRFEAMRLGPGLIPIKK